MVGEELRRERLLRGETVRVAGARAGIAHGTVVKLELGSTRLLSRALQAYAEHLGLQVIITLRRAKNE